MLSSHLTQSTFSTESKSNPSTKSATPSQWSSGKKLRAREQGAQVERGAKYCIAISVVTAASTTERLNSLKRLMNSLLNTDYPLDVNLPLRISVDSDTAEDTLRYISSLSWPFGPKTINRRVKKGGLVAAVAESFFPSSPFDHGVILEDDIEVSPYWYRYLTTVLDLHYENPDPRIIGISLYNPRTIEVIASRGKFVNFDSTKITKETLYAHQVPCSWGAVWFPTPWMEFLTYLSSRIASDPQGQHPMTLPGSNTITWKLSWKKFIIEMMYIKDLYMIYPSFTDQTSFATNHVEIGEHIKDKKSQKRFTPGFTIPIFTLDSFEIMCPLASFPSSLDSITFLDIFGRPILSPTKALSEGAILPPSTSWDPPRPKNPTDSPSMSEGMAEECKQSIRDKEFPFFFPTSLAHHKHSITIHLINSPSLLSQIHHYGVLPFVKEILVSHLDNTVAPPPNLRIGSTSVTFLLYETPTLASIFSPSSKASAASHILYVPQEILVAHKDMVLLNKVSIIHPKSFISFAPVQTTTSSYDYLTMPIIVPSEYLEQYACNPLFGKLRDIIRNHGKSCIIPSILHLLRPSSLIVKPTEKIKRYVKTENSVTKDSVIDKCVDSIKSIVQSPQRSPPAIYIWANIDVGGGVEIFEEIFDRKEFADPFQVINSAFPDIPELSVIF